MNSNRIRVFNGKSIFSTCAALLLSGVLSHADTIVLTNGNSGATVDLGSSAGMNSWAVEGQNQLHQQWFWYRVGSGLAQPINMIGEANYTTTGTDFLSTTYSSALFNLTVEYTLAGGTFGSGAANIQETIMVHNNNSTEDLNFHLYQYSDFDLLDSPLGDTTVLWGDEETGYNFAQQTKGPTQIAELINLPPANHGEVSEVPNTLNALNSTPDLMLSRDRYAEGNVSWALQWDTTVEHGQDFLVFKGKTLSIAPIPEPSALALSGLALAAWGLARRRQSA
jgi:hypothetical protein